MRVAVTGATGHVGGVLVRTLLDEGFAVSALEYAPGRALEGLPVRRVQGDVLNPATLRTAFEGAETVYHLAAMITLGNDPTGIVRRVNVEGTRNVIAACRAAGVRRLVHFSSVHALSPYPESEPVTESRPLGFDPHLPAYDRTKAEAEVAVLEAAALGLDAVILNPSAVIGPYDYERSRMGEVFADLYARRLPALVAGGFNWVDVRDVCASAITAARVGERGARYLLGGVHLSLRSLAERVTALTGIPAPPITTPMSLARLAAPFSAWWAARWGREARFTPMSLRALSHHQVLDCGKAARELGHRPRPIDETIADIYRWLADDGRIGAPPTLSPPGL